MSNRQPRILGLGYTVPSHLRSNDDPIFNWLKAHAPKGPNPFEGYVTRVVLGPGEDLMTMMVPAALQALEAAKLKPCDIDMLLGYASVSPFSTPNELSLLHHMLDLPERACVIPLNCEFSNFNAGLLLADALILSGRAKNILIVVGTNWTRHVDYHTPQAASAADGAGAAVVGLSSAPKQWHVTDQNTVTMTNYFGSMYMQGHKYEQTPPKDRHEWLWSDPYFQITPEGLQTYAIFGGEIAPTAVIQLLKRHNIDPSSITLIPHQSAPSLLEAWQKLIKPAQMVETMKTFANMTAANIPVNLAWSVAHNPIKQDNLVLFALAPDAHASALLLQRSSENNARPHG